MPDSIEAIDIQPAEDPGVTIPAEWIKRLGGGDLGKGRAELRMFMADNRGLTINRGPTAQPPEVRFANQADEAAIYELLLLDLEENARNVAPVSSGRVLAHIQGGTRGQGGVVGVIDGPDGAGPIAVVILMPFQWWWSEEFCLQEIVSFVHPEFRNGRRAAALIEFSCWLSDFMSASAGKSIPVLMGVTAVHRVAAKIRLLARKVTRVGIFCMYPTPKDLTDE